MLPETPGLTAQLPAASRFRLPELTRLLIRTEGLVLLLRLRLP